MLDEIVASQSGFNGSRTSSATSSLDKDDFLQLLVTQMQHQDPLNPLDDKEFIAQLAQFSSLEQMNNIAAGLDTLNETVTKQDALGAASYVGKYVSAEGKTISKLSDGITPLYFTLNDNAANVIVNVYDQNNNIVYSELLGKMQSGEYTYSWDGLDYNGNESSNGQYNVYFSATDSNDGAVLVDTEVAGLIIGITKDDSGVMFTLNDGRSISFDDIKMVTALSSASDDTSSADTVSSEASSDE